MDELELDDFLSYYYRSPDPERALEAIRYFVSTSFVEDPLSCAPVSYFFARIAQEQLELVLEYEELLGGTRSEGKPFIKGIIEELKSTPSGPINALDRTVQAATDNDLLWVEFFVTGNKQAVRRIIQVLEWRDLVRERLEAWLHSEPSFRFLGLTDLLRSRRLRRLQCLVGIECSYESKRIETVEDLDCWCMLEKLEMSSNRFQEAKSALPFHLAGEDLSHLGVKASAKWSLNCNSKQHPLVLEACEEGILRKDGRAKLALLEIAVDVHLFHGNYGAAAGFIRQYLQWNPSHSDMLAGLLKAEYEIELDWLIESFGKESATRESDLAVPAESGRTCAEKTGATSAYATHFILRDRTEETAKTKDYVTGEWRLEFKAPDQFHVSQYMFPHDYDEWVSLGPDTYQNAGLWFRAKDWQHEDLNQLLRGGKWLEVMRVVAPVAGSSYRFHSKRYLLLEYVTEGIGDLLHLEPEWIEMLDVPGEIRIWIDVSTMLLAKAELSLDGCSSNGEEVHIDVQQVFTAYDRDFRIDAPTLDLV